ncbi:unnamed protein product, partial [Polarella glacialis]
RARHSERAWRAEQLTRGELVPVGHEELKELLRSHLAAQALEALLPVAAEAEAKEEGLQDVQCSTPTAKSASNALFLASPVRSASSVSPEGKKKSRGWLSGFRKKSSSDKGFQGTGADAPALAFAGSAASSTPAVAHPSIAASQCASATAEGVARQWASLQEAVQRLRDQRRESDLRCRALRASAVAEVERVEAQAAKTEDELTVRIAMERGRQAELSALAEEQRQLLAQLL